MNSDDRQILCEIRDALKEVKNELRRSITYIINKDQNCGKIIGTPMKPSGPPYPSPTATNAAGHRMVDSMPTTNPYSPSMLPDPASPIEVRADLSHSI